MTYVRSVDPIHNDALPAPAAAALESPQVAALNNPEGKRMFEGSCESGHTWTGAGATFSAAQLTGARAVNDVFASNVMQVLLTGSGSSDGRRPYMPSFAAAYSDEEISAVSN